VDPRDGLDAVETSCSVIYLRNPLDTPRSVDHSLGNISEL